jgi:hypothetical protein
MSNLSSGVYYTLRDMFRPCHNGHLQVSILGGVVNIKNKLYSYIENIKNLEMVPGNTRRFNEKGWSIAEDTFLGTFAKLQKASVSFLTSVCSHARLNVAPVGRDSMKFDIVDFHESLLIKSKFGWNRTRTSGSLHKAVSTFCFIDTNSTTNTSFLWHTEYFSIVKSKM